MYSRASSMSRILFLWPGPPQRGKEFLALFGKIPRIARVHIIKKRFGTRRGFALRLANCVIHQLKKLPSKRLVALLAPELALDHSGLELFDWIAGLPLLHLARIPVTGRIVRRRVRAQPIGLCLDQRRTVAAPSTVDGFRARRVYLLHCIPIYLDSRKAISRGLDRDRTARGLPLDRHRNRPVVVLAEKHHGNAKDPSEVHRHVEVRRRSRPVPQESHHHGVIAFELGCPGRTHRLGQLGADARGPAHLIDSLAGLVGGHLSAFGEIPAVSEHLSNVGYEWKSPQKHRRSLAQRWENPVTLPKSVCACDACRFLPGAGAVEANPTLPLQAHHSFIERANQHHSPIDLFLLRRGDPRLRTRLGSIGRRMQFDADRVHASSRKSNSGCSR